MFQVFAKIGWLLLQPIAMIAIFAVLGLLLSFTRRRWMARVSLLLCVALLVLFAFTTFGYVALQPLEGRFVRPAEPTGIAGIVVLGGGMDADVNGARGGWELNRSGDRFAEALRLALRYPNAKILLSGGASVLAPNAESEAAAGQRFFAAFGIGNDRVILEGASRDTEENAKFSKAAANRQPGETWLLVTSAYHMPRAVGLFRKAGFDVVPWPADYQTTGIEPFGFKLDQAAENFAVSQIALREWTGLLAYYLTGRTAELVPGP